MTHSDRHSHNDKTYLVVGKQPWNRRVYEDIICHYPGKWHFVDHKDALTLESGIALNPRYIFFLHWSHKVPDELLEKYECVCFHMTDVPYGRGGSPLQNLIIRGHRSTRLTALRMQSDFDTGPIYMKKDLSLEGSTAEEIYIRASYLSADMIRTMIAENPAPVPQTGEPLIFKRRKPEQSAIPRTDSLQFLHDFIRMLDAEGYPKAFLEHHGFRYEFSRAALYDGRIVADVTITPDEKDIDK